MGEFELSWCLHKLPQELLEIERIDIYKTDETMILEIKEDHTSRRIDMSILKEYDER